MTQKREISIIAFPIALVFVSILYISVLVSANSTTINPSKITRFATTSIISIKPSKNGLASISLNTYSGRSVSAGSNNQTSNHVLGSISGQGIDLASTISNSPIN